MIDYLETLTKNNRPIILTLPGLGRVAVTRDRGGSGMPGQATFETNLKAAVFHKGIWQGEKDLGSGLVTNVGAMAMANDFAWASDCQTLKLANYHYSGTGTTAAATTDIILATGAGPTPATGSQSLVSGANVQKYQTIGTLAYTGTLAITEWCLFTDSTVSSTTGSPFSNTSATTGTVTATPLTASSSSVRGSTNRIVVAGTTTSYGLITSNSTSVFTIPAWYKTTDGTAGSTPGTTETYAVRPVMFDRKVFSAINVINGDSIQFTYQLTVTSGG